MKMEQDTLFDRGDYFEGPPIVDMSQDSFFEQDAYVERLSRLAVEGERTIPCERFEYYSHISLNTGDVLMYKPAADIQIFVIATGDESCVTYEEDDGDGTVTEITSKCEVWYYRDGSVEPLQSLGAAFWVGRENDLVCLANFTRAEGQKNIEFYEAISCAERPPTDTEFIKVHAEHAGLINLGIEE